MKCSGLFAWVTLVAIVATTQVSMAAPGDLYTVDDSFIRRYNGSTGAFIEQVSTAGFSGNSSIHLTFGPDGNLFGNGANGYIYKYDFNTNLKTTFVSDVIGANSFAFHPNGDLYTVDDSFIRRYNGSTGAFIEQVSTAGFSGNSSIHLTFGPDGNLFGNGANGYIYKYDFNTNLKTTFVSDVIGANSFAFHPNGDLYTVDDSFIRRYNGSTGAFIEQVSTAGFSGNSSIHLTFGPDGNLFGNGANGYIYKYDFNTNLKTTFVSDVIGANSFDFQPIPEPPTIALVVAAASVIFIIISLRRNRLTTNPLCPNKASDSALQAT